MERQEFNEFCDRRKEWMLKFVWPQIEKRLAEGMTPEQIAKDLASQGYWGLSSNRIGVGEIHLLWEQAMLRQGD
jgi:hypothetical protein